MKLSIIANGVGLGIICTSMAIAGWRRSAEISSIQRTLHGHSQTSSEIERVRSAMNRVEDLLAYKPGAPEAVLNATRIAEFSDALDEMNATPQERKILWQELGGAP